MTYQPTFEPTLGGSGNTKRSGDAQVRMIDPLTDTRWDEFVLSHPAGLVFHTAAWARVLIETYDYQPRYFVLENQGRIQAAWPFMYVASRLTGRRLVSLPFCDHCPPLVQTPAEVDALLDAVLADQQELGSNRIEVRGWPHHLVQPPERLTPVHYFSNHALALCSDPQELLRKINRGTRTSIKQAERKGVKTRLAESKEDLAAFYELNVMVRRRHGILPQPFSFFEAIDRYFIQRGFGHIMLGELDARPIAALLCLTHQRAIVQKFSVSDDSFWEYRANNVVWWANLSKSCMDGFEKCDAGRSGPDDIGLATFKERWGFQREDLPYYYHPQPGGFGVSQPTGIKQHALNIFTHVAPSSVFVAAGKHLYRHLG